jgi:hypothetical protein
VKCSDADGVASGCCPRPCPADVVHGEHGDVDAIDDPRTTSAVLADGVLLIGAY